MFCIHLAITLTLVLHFTIDNDNMWQRRFDKGHLTRTFQTHVFVQINRTALTQAENNVFKEINDCLFDNTKHFTTWYLVFTQGRRQRGGQWCPASPFEIGASPFHVCPPVAAYIQYCVWNMWPPLLGFGPTAAKSWRRACSCDKTTDGKMALNRECCFTNYTKSW